MNQYFRYDGNGYYIEPALAEECPEDCTQKMIPQPCWSPRWDGIKWIEERPDPHNGKMWNPKTKEWDVDPPAPARDYAAFLDGLMEELENE